MNNLLEGVAGGSSGGGGGGYDWNDETNKSKWRGVLTEGLSKLLRHQQQSGTSGYPSDTLSATSTLLGGGGGLTADHEALDHVEGLLINLLVLLTKRPLPLTMAQVEEKATKTLLMFDNSMVYDQSGGIVHKTVLLAQDVIEKGKPVLWSPSLHKKVVRVLNGNKVEDKVTQFLIAILECIANNILRVTVEYVTNLTTKQRRINRDDIKTAMHADASLMGLGAPDHFGVDSCGVSSLGGGVVNIGHFPFGSGSVVSAIGSQDIVDLTSHFATRDGHFGVSGDFKYEDVVKELLADERGYLRDLNMVSRLFYEVAKRNNLHRGDQDLLDAVFSNMADIADVTLTFVGLLEDTLEMTEEGHAPAIGSCFYELAEAEEFAVYERYLSDVLSPTFRKNLNTLVSRQPEMSRAMASECSGAASLLSATAYRDAFKYYLPTLLLQPVYHCSTYFKSIDNLKMTTENTEELETLHQVSGMLTPLQKKVEHEVRKVGFKAKSKPSDKILPDKIQQLKDVQDSIEKWEGKHIMESSSELIQEGKLLLYDKKQKKFEERHVFLCDGMVVLCKPQKKSSQSKFSLKYPMKGVEVEDMNETRAMVYGGAPEDARVMFELDPKRSTSGGGSNQPSSGPAGEGYGHGRHSGSEQPNANKLVFKAESVEEKSAWMSSFIMLTTRPLLEKTLDLTLQERKRPLRLPKKERYEFSEPDTENNIVFVQPGTTTAGSLATNSSTPAQSSAHENLDPSSAPAHPITDLSTSNPPIKGATLIKLVERLTYHEYADPQLRNAFLITYRTFCTPDELLDLLIKRFDIPELEFSSDSGSDSELTEPSGPGRPSKGRIEQDMKKRFKKEYSQPVQLRVLNVIKHWVDQHFYDFEQPDGHLIDKLEVFLNECSGKAMHKWVDGIRKKIYLRKGAPSDAPFDQFNGTPPDRREHLEKDTSWKNEGWPELLVYHPLEIARQLTLLEFEYYRAVDSSELVDQAWMSKDKVQRCPNLLRVSAHSNNFTWYLQKLIVETENFEERCAVVQRVLEIMVALHELNNFNGLLAINAAMQASSIYRLQATKDQMNKNLASKAEKYRAYPENRYQELNKRLRKINPPCVPFLGVFQTMIKFTEDAKADFLEDKPDLINFSKRSMVAEIIAEIQRYQHQPYCLDTYPELKDFLANLNPFPDMNCTEIDNYLWAKSSDLEKHCSDTQRKRPKEAERRWKSLDLRSPGIKHKPSHLAFTTTLGRQPKVSHGEGGGGGGSSTTSHHGDRHHHERACSSSGTSNAGNPVGAGNESDSPAVSPPGHRGTRSPGSTTGSTPKHCTSSTPISPSEEEKIVVHLNGAGKGPPSTLTTVATPPPLPPKNVPPPLPPRPTPRKEPRSPHMDPVNPGDGRTAVIGHLHHSHYRDSGVHSPPFRRGPSLTSSNGLSTSRPGGPLSSSSGGPTTGPSPMSISGSTPRSPRTGASLTATAAPPTNNQSVFSFSPHHLGWGSEGGQGPSNNGPALGPKDPNGVNAPQPPPRPPKQPTGSSNVFKYDLNR